MTASGDNVRVPIVEAAGVPEDMIGIFGRDADGRIWGAALVEDEDGWTIQPPVLLPETDRG